MSAQTSSFNLIHRFRTWMSQVNFDPFGGLTATEMTRLSWARKVDNYAALPEVYCPFVDAQLARRSDLPHAVLTPTFRGFLKQENEHLVFSLDEKLFILERSNEQIIPTVYPLEKINYVELGEILLHAWLKVSGVGANGERRVSTLKFNSVTDLYFNPFIQQIRCAAGASLPVDRKREITCFDCLENANFKFMNYARRSLLDGERVDSFVLQPEIIFPRLALGRWTLGHKTISPAHLCILTDRELIVVRDDPEGDRYRTHARYGGVWDFIPRRKISRITMQERGDGLMGLIIHMPLEDSLGLLFDEQRRADVEALVRQVG
jgi:hypothetical protein